MAGKNLRGWAFTTLIFTILWLVLMIFSVSQTGTVSTFEQALHYAANPGFLFYATYLNAVMVTLAATIFFVHLYVYCKPFNRELAVTGMVFIPVYCMVNLFVYFSQITILPRLLAAVSTSANPEIYQVLAGQFIQLWPGSITAVFNQLAYGLLGIPSIIFGMLLVKHKKALSLGGWLLGLNGVVCIFGVVGTAVGSDLLSAGSVVGGALFLFAMLIIALKTDSSTT